MFNFFDSFIQFLQTIVDLIVSGLEIIAYLITYIVQGFGYLFVCFSYLPTFCRPFVMAVTSFVIILTVVNKGK